MKNPCSKSLILLLLFLLSIAPLAVVSSQEQAQATDKTLDKEKRLNRLVDALDKKVAARVEFRKIAGNSALSTEAQIELDELNSDIDAMTDTFELLTAGDFDEGLFKVGEDVPFDWRVELMLVLEPLIDSLQSLTEKPRQMSAIRSTIELNQLRLQAADQALVNLESLREGRYETDTKLQIEKFQKKWVDRRESYEQRLVAAQAQLERLERLDSSSDKGILPTVRGFIIGRGLTLLMAIAAAAFGWALIKFIWWVFSTHIVNKQQRRESLWYRLLSYSMYLVNIIVCIAAVLVILYLREDLLLLGLALLLLALTAIGIRRFIPGYVREARLLLDLGSVREGERVMYNNLPWQVMSINLHTVLRNPALEGIIRLPIETIGSLMSRPVKDKNWFPSGKGDFLLLPDSTFAEVLSQTPELVELRIRGGMIQSIPSSDFYAMNIINLSSGKTFGIAVTFGFDYGLQSISLTEIPGALNESIKLALEEQGYSKHIENVMVELKTASASSIDYLVYLTVDSEKASDYFRLERLIQQTCIAVANEKDWNIPFPQMKIHYEPTSAA